MKLLVKPLLLALTWMMTVYSATAQNIRWYNKMDSAIKVNDTLVVADTAYLSSHFNWNSIKDRSTVNIVKLEVDYTRLSAALPDFFAQVDLEVTYFSVVDSNPTMKSTIPVVKNHSLRLSKNEAGGELKLADQLQFTNGYDVRIKVKNIASDQYDSILPPLFKLSSWIYIDRHQVMNASAGQYSLFALTEEDAFPVIYALDTSSGNKTVNVQRGTVWGAVEYDLEWTFIDSTLNNITVLDSIRNHQQVSEAALNTLFKHNANRIFFGAVSSYKIPLVANSDFLMIRMRTVSYDDGKRVEGSWQYRDAAQQFCFLNLQHLRHQQNLNWIYTANFIEEGLRAESINFFDGNFTSKQNIVLDNENSTAIVNESIYDRFNRQVGSFLPAPTPQNNLWFKTNFNVGLNNKPFDYKFINDSVNNCCITAPAVANSSGAGNYYSSASWLLAQNRNTFDQYTPSADSFPYSLQQFTDDATGRIRYQGGVGKQFQLNENNGKYTSFFYGKPGQYELDKLFGNNAGFAQHYLKNLTVDPNGVLSVSYLNAAGNVIATALSGLPAGNLESIASLGYVTEDYNALIDLNGFTYNEAALSIEAASSHLNVLPGTIATVKYTVQNLSYLYQSLNLEACNKCYYELELKVQSDCDTDSVLAKNKVLFDGNTLVCENGSPFIDSALYPMNQIGEYKFSMQLSMSRQYIDSSFTALKALREVNNDIKKEADFLVERFNTLVLDDNFKECGACFDKLGKPADFKANIKEVYYQYGYDSLTVSKLDTLIDNKYTHLLEVCKASQDKCIIASPCDDSKQQMLADLQPGGQYFLIDTTRLQPNGDYVILEPNINFVYKVWKQKFFREHAADFDYINDSVFVDNERWVKVYDSSVTFNQLVQHWKPSWSEKFLEFHPEYCQLLFCQTNSYYKSWDNLLTNFVNDTAGLHKLYFDNRVQYHRDSIDWLLKHDTFFKFAPAAIYDSFRLDLEKYTTRVLAIDTDVLPEMPLARYIDMILYCGDSTGSSYSPCVVDNECRSEVREFDLYKQLYLERKEYYYNEYRDDYVCTGTCFIGSAYNDSFCVDPSKFTISEYQLNNNTPQTKVLLITFDRQFNYDSVIVHFKDFNTYTGANPKKMRTITFPSGKDSVFLEVEAYVNPALTYLSSTVCYEVPITVACLYGESRNLDLSSYTQLNDSLYFRQVIDTNGIFSDTIRIIKGLINQPPLVGINYFETSVDYYGCLNVKHGTANYNFTQSWLVYTRKDSCEAQVLNLNFHFSRNDSVFASDYPDPVFSGSNFLYFRDTVYTVIPGVENVIPHDSLGGAYGTTFVKEFFKCLKIDYYYFHTPTSVTYENVWLIGKRVDVCDTAQVIVADYRINDSTYYQGGYILNVKRLENIYTGYCPGYVDDIRKCLKIRVGTTTYQYYQRAVTRCNNCTDVFDYTLTATSYNSGGSYFIRSNGDTVFVYANVSPTYTPPVTGASSSGWYKCARITVGATHYNFYSARIVIKPACDKIIFYGWNANGSANTSLGGDVYFDFLPSRCLESVTYTYPCLRIEYPDGSLYQFYGSTKQIYVCTRYLGGPIEEFDLLNNLSAPNTIPGTFPVTILEAAYLPIYQGPIAPQQYRYEIRLDLANVPCSNGSVYVDFTFRRNDTTEVSRVWPLDPMTGGVKIQWDYDSVYKDWQLIGTAAYLIDCEPTCFDEYAYKKPVFRRNGVNYVNMGVHEGNIQDITNDKANTAIINTCENYVEDWLLSLAYCNTISPGSLQQLKDRMLAVCKLGSPVNTGIGGSTTAPGVYSAYGDSSFVQIFKDVIGTTLEAGCNPYLLEKPYPKATGGVIGNTHIQKTNTEICSALNTYIVNAGTTAVDSVWRYVRSVTGNNFNLSETEFALLAKSCNNCNYILDYNIPDPNFYANSANNCLTATKYTQLKNDLLVLIPALSVSDSLYPVILRNYMNHQLGYQLSAGSYQEYEAAIAVNAAATLCNINIDVDLSIDLFADVTALVDRNIRLAQQAYGAFIENERRVFSRNYWNTCAYVDKKVDLKSSQNYYHFTLYYYDQNNLLVGTVPPEGVVMLNNELIDSVQTYRQYTYQDMVRYPLDTVGVQTTGKITGVWSGSKSVELWLSGNTGKWVFDDNDNRYIYRVYMSGNSLFVDLNGYDAGNNLTLKYQLKSPVLALNNVNHVVLNTANILTGVSAVYVNAQPVVLTAFTSHANALPAPSAGISLYNDVLQLRLYDKQLSHQEIKSNAYNVYLYPHESLQQKNILKYWLFNNKNDVQLAVRKIVPDHQLFTRYTYNSHGAMAASITPDAGRSDFKYDETGRLVLSQNARQAEVNSAQHNYSYTVYEPILGRIVEVGEVKTATQNFTESFVPTGTATTLIGGGTKKSITRTFYDESPVLEPGFDLYTEYVQNNLRNRVAATVLRRSVSDENPSIQYYSYDIAGNVKDYWTQVPGLGIKHLSYEYELHSGAVNLLKYQPGKTDQFYYRYKYNANKKLTHSYSSFRAMENTTELIDPVLNAHYSYYLHGPLARVEYDENKVQGVDYAYTLQGWLKYINGEKLLPVSDIGSDGKVGGVHEQVARDVFAYSIGYYQNDYTPVNSSLKASQLNNQTTAGAGESLYNGNISYATLAQKNRRDDRSLLYAYRYDQLNRIQQVQSQLLSNGTVNWNGNNNTESFAEYFKYDANGNILNVWRKDSSGNAMDSLHYRYHYGAISINGKKYLQHNRLNSVNDQVSAGAYGEDIDAQAVDNYQYDAIGNLVADAAEGIIEIQWNVYGKIDSIRKQTDTGVLGIRYTYDATGQRIKKSVTAGGISKNTYYVKDPQGNVLSLYEELSGNFTWREQHLYGSSRLGIWRIDTVPTAADLWKISNYANRRQYELSNHLGNVMGVIGDHLTIVNDTTRYPSVFSLNDYYVFGAAKRWSGSEGYRYGFNGKENDNEVKGEGNQQDYGMRIYDPRLGKFLSVDPLTKDYPWYTPYQFAGNKPIRYVDIDGMEEGLGVFERIGKYGFTGLMQVTWKDVDITLDAINRNINPLGIAVHGIYAVATGKDLITGEPKDRLSSATNIGVEAVSFMSGAKLMNLGMSAGAKMEQAALRNYAYTPLIVKQEATQSTKSGIQGGMNATEMVVNSKGVAYPKVVVEGFGEVPFPKGPFVPNNSQILRNEFTPKLKAEFKDWWIQQGRPWPNVPEGSTLNIHHIKPLSQGGTNSFDNLVPLIQPQEHQPFTNWWRGFKE
jgi:RHS repeat-associated protein